MADRVLNFSEFQTKYSQEGEQDNAATLSDFSAAANNFSTAFDDSTYDEAPIGPKRPIASGEATPAQPGEMGAPKFDSSATSGMEFPDEEPIEPEEGDEINPTYGEYDYADGGNPEDEDEEGEDEEDEDEEDEDEEDEDEEGEEEEDEDEEEANESRSWYRSRGLVESFDAFSTRGGQPKEYDKISNEIELIDFSDPDDEEGDYDADYWQDDEDVPMPHDDEGIPLSMHSDGECYAYCKSCGSKKMLEPGDKPHGTMNQMDPDSWWQGTELGMQCGCNMKS